MGKSKETWNESNRVGGRVQLLATPTPDVTNRLITNLGLGIGTADGRYEIAVLAKNIFDEFYATCKTTYSATGAPRYVEIVFRAKL